jgi:predicted ATP-grasp superfamily ATP-dependent carboligase
LLDKAHTLRFSEETGFPVPAWIDPPTKEAVVEAAAEIGFPCVVKPRRSFQSINGAVKQLRHEIVRDRDQAAAAAEALTGSAGPPIVQALVSGRSLAVTAVIRDGTVLATAARETLSAFPLLGGNSVRRRTISNTEPGVAEALELLVSTGLSGLAEAEYQVDSAGTPRLMEIGPRPHGWVTLAVAAGVDLPRYSAAVALGLAIEPSPPSRVGVEMSWPGGELYRLRAALSRSTAVPYPLTRRQVLAAAWPPWRPGMRYDGIDVRDLGPMLPRRFREASERSKFAE